MSMAMPRASAPDPPAVVLGVVGGVAVATVVVVVVVVASLGGAVTTGVPIVGVWCVLDVDDELDELLAGMGANADDGGVGVSTGGMGR